MSIEKVSDALQDFDKLKQKVKDFSEVLENLLIPVK